MGRALVPGTNEYIEIPDNATPDMVEREVQDFLKFRGGKTAAPTDDGVTPVPVSDASDTDDWTTYLSKMGTSIAREGAAGLGETVDFLGNTVAVAPRIGYNLYQGKPAFSGFGRTDVQDVYEANVPKGPAGSDYETAGSIAKVLVPAVAETAMTGSPKSALLRSGVGKALTLVPRAAANAGLGYGGGQLAELGARAFGGDENLQRIAGLVGSALSPASLSTKAAKVGAALKSGGLSIPLLWATQRAIPKAVRSKIPVPDASITDLTRRAPVGVTTHERER